MKKTHLYNWRAWLIKAEEDELSLEAVLKEGAASTACFLAQQMAEKFLKALMLYHGKQFPKIHDLLELASRLREVSPGIRNLLSDLTTLNRYYIETRYPGDYSEFSKSEAKAAYESARRVKDYVWKKLDL